MTAPPSTPAEHAEAVAALLSPVLDRLSDDSRAESIGVAAAAGRVLSKDVHSPVMVPPFTNSQMDGYAVQAADLKAAAADSPVRLHIGRTSAAGDAVHAHAPGTASPVMTGAPIPSGADAVVPIERADPPHFLGIDRASGANPHESATDASVGFSAPIETGAFVREAGADLAAGSTILPAGTRLGPAQLGSLASAGITELRVRRRLTVLLLSTGHELRAPGDALSPGQIYDANTASLTAAMASSGAIVRTAFAPDVAPAVLDVIAQHPDVDLIVTTGGVSAGAFEVVRDALEPAGVRFGKVAMQPGGPQGLGNARVGGRDVPVIAFPGNPVSALLSFEMFLRPVLHAAAGLNPSRRSAHAPLTDALDSPRDKHQIRRGRLREDGSVEVGAPGSHLLHDYARATVLVHVPIGVDELPAGADVEVWRIDE